MNVTQKQIDLINAIAYSEFQPTNGAEPETFEDLDWVWADCVMDSRVDGGTFTSLVNAGLAQHSGNSGRDACVRLTQEGFRAFQIALHG